MGRLLVVSATDALARGFLSIAPASRSGTGTPTNALMGAVRTVRRALAFKTPDVAVAVVDGLPPPAAWPDDLKAQVPALPELLQAHGLIVVVSDRPGQLVAAYVRAGLEAGHDVVVAGSDKRLGQLVSDRVWWYEGHKDVRYTPEAVRKRFGVAADRVADWIALAGDGDALKGVPGIGAKGAVGVLTAHGTLAAAIDDPDAVEGRAGKALRANLELARDRLTEATWADEVPLPTALDNLTYVLPTVANLNEAYRTLGLFALLAAEARDVSYGVCATIEAAETALGTLGDGPVAVHALIEDPSPPRGDLVGVALCGRPGHAVYVPSACLPGIRGWLEDAGKPKVGHDVKVAMVALARIGVTLRGVGGDRILASHLADPSGSAPHELERVVRIRLQRALQPEDAIRGTGRKRLRWRDVNASRAGAHACQLAEAALALWQHFEPTVQHDLLIEHLALSETLVRMERVGMPCDADSLRAAGDDFAAINEGLSAEIFALAGHPFKIGSTAQLGTVLFEELGLPVLSRTKTGWSTATHVLERLAHPIATLVIRWRQLQRLQSTWVNALIRAIDPDGRVRSTFHPARSFSGRLVNSQPDLGRVPGRTPELARIRQAFKARDGWTMLSVDYDQLGLYVLAHLTGDPALVEPLEAGGDVHARTAAAVLETSLDALTPDQRQLGKVVNFATFAGQGASALALQLQVEPAEAKQLIANFDRYYATVRAFQDGQLAHAREHGFIVTLAGRRWPIGDLTSHEPRDLAYAERLARRATHEASVADVTRRGLLRADQALRAAGARAVPLVQIHDEVLFEVPDTELDTTTEIAATAMRGAFDLRVPLRVGCKHGRSWGDLVPV